MQGRFVEKIHFFKFLCMIDQTMTRPAKNYYCYMCSHGTSFSESFNWYKKGKMPTRKGKYPVLRANTMPQQYIKHTKISYSRASLVFGKFSCVIYRNVLNRGTSKLRHFKYLKSTSFVSLIPFTDVLHFIILVYRVRYFKNSCLEDNRWLFSGVTLKSDTKDTHP